MRTPDYAGFWDSQSAFDNGLWLASLLHILDATSFHDKAA
jgi:hypothetical protein